jgi:hypothetical protein
LAHQKNVLEGFQDFGVIQKELFDNRGKILIVKDANLFEISRSLYALMKFAPLALKDIDLQIVVEVVDQKAHVHS